MQILERWHLVSSTAALIVVTACVRGPAPDIKSPEPIANSVDSHLTTVLSGKQRTAEERARDAYRHPKATLEFFGIQDAMTVVELSAGRGWYTAILAPLLNTSGSLTTTGADPNGPVQSEGTKGAQAFTQRLSQDPASFGKVNSLVVDWKKPDVSLGDDASVDLVLTFRNWHGWVRDGLVDTVLAAAFRVLKEGGTFGVVEHRGKAEPAAADPKVIGDTGYVPEAMVISAAEKAGFKLSAKSEINANPRDTKDYPKGVWTLPPTLRLGDVDRSKYVAIGESDRMTLKFIKP